MSSLEQATPVWVLSDDRPGHRTQLEGLVGALRERLPLRERWLPWRSRGPRSWWRALREPIAERPALLLAAGHRTHLPLLLLARRCRAPAVLLMRPSLPLAWFDLVVAPTHDGLAESNRVVLTQGVLNRARWRAAHDTSKGLILVGGPSAHHDWDGQGLLSQIEQLLSAQPRVAWTLGTSPRTPGGFVAAARARLGAGVRVVPFEDTAPDWLPRQLAAAAQVWISEDSVSMVYEALSAGAGVGLLAVPGRSGRSRVSRGLAQLSARGLAQRFETWDGAPLQPPGVRFNEAERVADIIVERFLPPSP